MTQNLFKCLEKISRVPNWNKLFFSPTIFFDEPLLKEPETVVLVRVLKEIYGICRGSLIFASLHWNFKTFIMGMAENLGSTRIVYTLVLWAPGRLKSGSSDSGRLVLGKLNAWTLVAWIQKMKIEFYSQRSRGWL